jgi:hypothetical protein
MLRAGKCTKEIADRAKEAMAISHGIEVSDLMERTKREEIPLLRAIIINWLHNDNNKSLKSISSHFPMKSNSVGYHCRKHKDRMETCRHYAQSNEAFIREIEKAQRDDGNESHC